MTTPSDCRLEKPTKIYSDAPTNARNMGGGQIEQDAHANLLIHWASSTLNNPPGMSTLALRWVFGGQRHCESEDGRFAVDDSGYLLFNAGRVFSSTIASATPVECLTLCFEECSLDEAYYSLITPADRLLAQPKRKDGPQLEFYERLYPHDDLVSPRLFHIQRHLESPGVTHGWFEEQFHCVFVHLLQAHRNVLREVETMPAARPSTREELYRRLHRARDYMEAGLRSPLTLTQIAQEACFSPHHFLRLFKQTFRETPHQYLTRRRIEQARQLLANTDMTVTDLCYTLGFESLGSFSWLFRRHVGVSPEGFRAQTRLRHFRLSARQIAARADAPTAALHPEAA